MEDSFYHQGAKGSILLARLRGAAGALLLLVGLLGCRNIPHKAEQPPEPPYQQIQESIEAGDAQAALRSYQEYLNAFPDSPVDRLLLARLLLAAGYFEQARNELSALSAESGPTIEVLLTLSHLERMSGNPERERQLLEQALEIDPGNAAVLAALGMLQLEAEQYDQATISFQGALTADPDEPTALRGLGLVYLNQERYGESIEFFGRAIATDPDNDLNYADRARARAAAKDRLGAVEDLSTAIEGNPTFYWNYIDRGRQYLQLRMLKEAEEDFSKAIALDPELFLAYVYRAGLYDRLDRRPQAIADYSRVLELNPDYFFAYAPLAVLYYLEGIWQSAAEAFRKSYFFEPEEPSYALLAALSWMQLGENEKAKEYLWERLGDLPQDSWILLIARYYLDPVLEARTIDAANKESNKLKRGQMLFYIASRLLLEDRVETALRYLLLVKDIDRRGLPEKRIAEHLLARFGYED
ncbi:MAG: tetratricopeptide repeat protein [Spirochaetaceae bacterium]|nr:MAG: tetratricopeptide repeat protein [Spirochaetaceae bacterium]